MENNLDLAYTVNLLSLLVESSENYIDDGSWLESLTDDIKNAKQLIRKYKKLTKTEEL
jgi:hypothetical protein